MSRNQQGKINFDSETSLEGDIYVKAAWRAF